MSHAVKRTTPTGSGTKLKGRCVKCGQDGLGIGDALKDCPADSSVSDEQALISIITMED